MRRFVLVGLGLVVNTGCNVDTAGGCLGLCSGGGSTGAAEDSSDTGASSSDSGGSLTSSSGEPEPGVADSSGDGSSVHFDLGPQDLPSSDADCEGRDCACVLPHTPCDAGTDDPFAAMGVNCPGEPELETSMMGPMGPTDYYGLVELPAGAIGVRSSFGGTDTYAPRAGESYAVIGTGFIPGLDLEPKPEGFEYLNVHQCNDDLGDVFDPPGLLPPPILSNAVDCEADPTLVGTGDCSGTLEEQFNQTVGWFDWVQLELSGVVPDDASSFSFDFAFFTYEYPEYFGSQFNDMFIGWVESESWTGNVSFDPNGEPISLNASFFEFKDDAATAPEFAGTCMQGHAGTNWLTTSAPVTPGEDVRIAFAVFDASDSALDSYVFIDNFRWGCDDVAGPITEPAG